MRCIRSAQLLLGFCLVLICDAELAYADFMMLPSFGPPGPLGLALALMAIVFSVTTVVEFVVIYLMLGRPVRARGKLFVCALVISLITNPPAQIGVWL